MAAASYLWNLMGGTAEKVEEEERAGAAGTKDAEDKEGEAPGQASGARSSSEPNPEEPVVSHTNTEGKRRGVRFTAVSDGPLLVDQVVLEEKQGKADDPPAGEPDTAAAPPAPDGAKPTPQAPAAAPPTESRLRSQARMAKRRSVAEQASRLALGLDAPAAKRRCDSAPPSLERGRIQALQRRATRTSMHVRKSMFATGRSRATVCGLSAAAAALAATVGAASPAEAEEATEKELKGKEEVGAEGEAESKEESEATSEEEESEEESEDDTGLEMRKEEWPEFLLRAQAAVQAAGIENEPAALFEAFRTTDSVPLIFATFARLYHLATAPVAEGGRRKTVTCLVKPPWGTEDEGNTWTFPYEPIRVMLGGNFKAKRLWTTLDERTSRPEYTEAAAGNGRLHGQRCLVVGAGPVGLRTAVELRMLGANVTVVDQRRSFSRINQLHIWSWAGEDLKGLGAKLMDPPGSTFGSNPDLMHISISELQKFLLKICLLLGVEVLLGANYVDVKHTGGAWRAELSLALSRPVAEGRSSNWVCLTPSSQGPPPSPSAPRFINNISVLVGAGGFSSTIGEDLGMQMTEMGSLRRETAIGLICNLVRTNTKTEGKLRSYSLARQFYAALFKSTAQATGVELENVVYVKSSSSHYFVMTPTAKSLIQCGVVKDSSHQPLLDRRNLDMSKLDELMQKLANFPFKKDEPAVLQAMKSGADEGFPGYADGGPRLFDFSKMRRSQEGLKVVPPPGVDTDASGYEDDALLVTLVGDCLMEPFWPEGLGIIRGFFSALDACSAVKRWAEGADRVKTVAHFDTAFAKLKTLSAATRARVLQENEKKFGLAPESRYRL